MSTELRGLLVVLLVAFGIWLLQLMAGQAVLPAQDSLVPVLVIILLIVICNVQKMFFARNLLVGLLVYLAPTLTFVAGPGSLTPQAYLSFFISTLAGLGTVLIATIITSKVW